MKKDKTKISEIKIAIFTLNIRYYQMRIVQDQLHRYDNTNDENDKVRKVLIKSLKINEELFDEQDKKVNKLIMKIKRTKKQINKLVKKAIKNDGIFFGDTYENGIYNTIEWILGKTKSNPMNGVKILKRKNKRDKKKYENS